MRELGFELVPQCNAFQQGAACIDPWQAVAAGGIHVEMRVHKGWAEQQAAGIHGVMGWGLQTLADFGDFSILHGNRHIAAAIGQTGVGDEQIQHQFSFVR